VDWCDGLRTAELIEIIMKRRLDLATIHEAHNRIRSYVHRTPVLTCSALDDIIGARLYFKCENFQKTGAFKSRGACNAVLLLSQENASNGVVTHSSGNHAAALARAAKVRGISAHIVMPSDSSLMKIAAVKGYGGRIVFCDPNLAARDETADRVIRETGAVLIHPYDDFRVIAGQATIAVELLEDIPDLDVIVAPVGGGGLLSGMLLAAKKIKPQIQVIGAEPQAADDAYRSWKSDQLVPVGQTDTIADGLRTSLGEKTYPIICELVDDILLASEEGIIRAMRLILDRMKVVVEPSAAVPMAALLESDICLSRRKVGIVLSGGNIDLASLSLAK